MQNNMRSSRDRTWAHIDTVGRWQTLISVFSAPPRHSPKKRSRRSPFFARLHHARISKHDITSALFFTPSHYFVTEAIIAEFGAKSLHTRRAARRSHLRNWRENCRSLRSSYSLLSTHAFALWRCKVNFFPAKDSDNNDLHGGKKRVERESR